jgi:hypothetical protein
MRKLISITAALAVLGMSSLIAAQKVETVNGARIVHNEKGGKFGKDLPISIKLVRNLGDVDSADEHFSFNHPTDILMDDSGNILVLDSDNDRIQKFGPDGKYGATIGRRGQGPGEFFHPGSFDRDSRGLIWILDKNQNRILSLASDGKGDKHILLRGLFGDQFRLLNSGLFVVQSQLLDPRLKDQSRLARILKLLDQEGNAVKEFGEPFDYGDPLASIQGNFVDLDVDENDHIVVSFRFQNKIEKFSPDGSLLWTADRPLSYELGVKKKIKFSLVPGNPARGGSSSVPEMNICSTGIAADSKGRIWIVTYDKQLKNEEEVRTPTFWGASRRSGAVTSIIHKASGPTELRTTDAFKLEVFDANGDLLGEIPLTHFVDGIRIYGDNLFLLDQVRGVTFYQYKIVEQ